jgi:hypothetical protein
MALSKAIGFSSDHFVAQEMVLVALKLLVPQVVRTPDS